MACEGSENVVYLISGSVPQGAVERSGGGDGQRRVGARGNGLVVLHVLEAVPAMQRNHVSNIAHQYQCHLS